VHDYADQGATGIVDVHHAVDDDIGNKQFDVHISYIATKNMMTICAIPRCNGSPRWQWLRRMDPRGCGYRREKWGPLHPSPWTQMSKPHISYYDCR
jgi:hypothetical protein